VDPADYVQLTSVAQGQLLTIFGNDLANPQPFTPASGVAASTSNFGVFFNGIGAPILYSSANQINVQVPYEIAGNTTVQMLLMSNETPQENSETLTLAVEAQQPSIFLTSPAVAIPIPAQTPCGGTMPLGVAALAINADGTQNDCSNPARSGSTVTVFANGMGQVTPALATGAIASAPAVALSPAVMLGGVSLRKLENARVSLWLEWPGSDRQPK
jgi:uncharacterized protein (TIGR03437 family)